MITIYWIQQLKFMKYTIKQIIILISIPIPINNTNNTNKINFGNQNLIEIYLNY